MQRGELLLTLTLAALILAGAAYQALRGADKTAQVVITHPAGTPFDAKPLNESNSPPFSSADAAQTPALESQRLIQYLNQADHNQLEDLPGIGPVLAQRIVQKRQKIGRFTDLDDILDVSGIGKSRLAALLDAMSAVSAPTPPRLQPSQKSASVLSPSISSPAPVHRIKKSMNQATRIDLMEIPGIGEKTADAIIQARTEKGGFQSWGDVDAVPGIGEKRVEQIQQFFTLTPTR
ncbi:MAG: ComEA family DNA-binding protein [Candidatus Omnitrophica bacterium]|nr:ComEA family DNA-binding protein [Candidatus Omnitrophota bacterium]